MQSRKGNRAPLRRLLATASILMWTPAVALAQPGESDAPPEAVEQRDEETSPAADQPDILVTGTRIARRDFVADTPIVTVSADRLLETGQIAIEKTLAQLPQFGLGENATQTGFATTGQATLNLRGLGSARNLVLLDGRRLQPSNITQVVDVNTIPQALIQSVEIITGGASAVYGSDAIAGVVNFRTRRDFEGVQLDALSTITGEGDGPTRDIAATIGTNFAGGRGNVVASVGFSERERIRFRSRAFFRSNLGGTDLRIPVGVYNPSGNAPTQAAVNTLFATYGVAPGAVVRTSALSFNEDGSLFSANNGVFNFRGDYGGLLLNTGRQVNNLSTFLVLQAPLERVTAFGRATFDLTDTLTVYAQAQYADYETRIFVEPGNTSISIPVTNPFIPAALRPLLASRATPNANLILEKRFQEAGPRLTDRELTTYQVVGGLRGTIAAIDGSFDVYGSTGRSTIDEASPGSVLRTRLANLIAAPDGGNSICAGGYNPFGINPLSPACFDYLVAAPTRSTELTQDLVEATVQGGLFNLPGGQLRFAAGATWRSNGYSTTPDAILANGDVVGVLFSRASEGTSEVWEVYGELSVPILADRPFFESLGLELGYRYSDYAISGGAHTYKALGHWSPVAGLRFRGGFSRAVRAPSVGELFVAPSGSVPSIGQPSQGQGDPCRADSPSRAGPNAAAVRALCVAQGVPAGIIDTFVNPQNDSDATLIGNPDLLPEEADTWVAGITFTPRFASPLLADLSLSVDYFNIEVAGAIGVVSSLQSVTSCFNLDGSNPSLSPTNEACARIGRDPVTGRINQVLQPTQNLAAFRTSGVDVALRWGVPLFGEARLALDANVSYLESFEVQTAPGRPFQQFAGSVGGIATFQPGSLPEWKSVTQLTFTNGPVAIGGRWRHLDAMQSVQRVINPASTAPGVPSYDIYDVFAAVEVAQDFELRLGVNNVGDVEPLVVNGVAGSTEASTYDTIGRTFFVSARARF